MTVQYASDLHLEFEANSKYLAKYPIVPNADILVLAGDIGYLGGPSYENNPFWDWASVNFKQVLVTVGNHEFYGGYDICHVENGACGAIRENIYWYYNRSVVIDNTEFIMTPLWSHISPDAEYIIEHRVADFKYIKYNNKRLTVQKFNHLHIQAVEFIKDTLAKSNAQNKVVVSHHLPSLCCVTQQFKGNILGGAFASEQGDWIENCGANYWVYGHSHGNIGEITIGDTKLICNQLGYVDCNEHKNFNPSVQIIL